MHVIIQGIIHKYKNTKQRRKRMKRNKGQNLSEWVVIGAQLILICAVALYFFGDNLANIFENNYLVNLFKDKTRTSNTEKIYSYLSGITLTLFGKPFNSPVEAAILEDINNQVSSASGSEGHTVRETVNVIEKQIEQLIEILNYKLAVTTKPNLRQKLMALIERAKYLLEGCQSYESMDGKYANEKNKRIVNDIDVSVKLDKNGELAKNFDKELKELVFYLEDDSLRDVIQLYGEGILNLGESLKYKIDSRILRDLISGIQTKTESDNFTDVAEILDNWLTKSYFTTQNGSGSQIDYLTKVLKLIQGGGMEVGYSDGSGSVYPVANPAIADLKAQQAAAAEDIANKQSQIQQLQSQLANIPTAPTSSSALTAAQQTQSQLNSRLLSLQSQLAAAQKGTTTSIPPDSDKIASLQSQVNSLTSQKTALQNQVNSLQSNPNTVKTGVALVHVDANGNVLGTVYCAVYNTDCAAKNSQSGLGGTTQIKSAPNPSYDAAAAAQLAAAKSQLSSVTSQLSSAQSALLKAQQPTTTSTTTVNTALVASLQNQVNDVKAQMTSNQQQITYLQNQLNQQASLTQQQKAALQSQISQLQQQISSLQSSQTSLQKQIDALPAMIIPPTNMLKDDRRFTFTEKMQGAYDFTLNTSIQLDKTGGSGSAGVFFRAEKIDTDVSGYSIEIDDTQATNGGTNNLILYKWTNGNKEAIRTQALPSNVDIYSKNDYQVVVEGNNIKAFVNGKETINATDYTYTQGDAGMHFDGLTKGIVYDYSTEYQTNIDNKQALLDWANENADKELEKTIDVYRDGNFSEILPESYNNKVMCESLEADIVNKNCSL